MLRVLLRLALLATPIAASACSEPPKAVKRPKNKQTQRDAKALLAEARDDAKNGDNDAADKAYAEAYATDKSFDTLEEYVVDFLLHAGRASKAVEVSKAYVDGNISDAKGYNLYAEALLGAEDAKTALDVADQLIQLKGADDPAGHEKKGRALIKLEKNQDGLDELRKARDLDPKSATYHKQLGIALSDLKEVDEAQLEFRAAIKADPNDPEAHVLLGMALRNQGELDEAKSWLDKAIELDPRNGRAYFEMGLLYNVEKKQADSEQALAKAVQLSPSESKFWYAYGQVFQLTERYDEAISAYKKAVELDPPYVKALVRLGGLYVDRKQYDDAETLLTQAIRRDAKTGYLAYFFLGELYEAKKKNPAALDNYEKFVKAAPKNDDNLPRAHSAIEQLKHHR